MTMRGQDVRRRFKAVFTVLAAGAFFAGGCGITKLDIDTEEGRRAILRATNLALTRGECVAAVNLIEPLYDSPYSSNLVRLVRASAHGCHAGIPDYLGFLDTLTAANLVGGEFWVSMARLFPHTDLSGLQSGWYAADSTMAAISPTALPFSQYLINPTTYNPSSLISADRTQESNAYLVLTSMAVIGRSENRNGAPNATFNQTQDLPWTTPAAMNQEGCGFAGAVVNMLDGLSAVIEQSTGSLKTTLQLIGTTFETAVSTACETGCTACGFAAGTCTPSGSFCPYELRNRDSCTPVNTNRATCAANGIVDMVNADPLIGWP